MSKAAYMRILLFASAPYTVTTSAIGEFRKGFTEMFVLIPARAWDNYFDLFCYKDVECIRLSIDTFHNVPESDLQGIKGLRFDTAVIVSGEQGFVGFNDVVEIVSKLHVDKLIFYNVTGKKSMYVPPEGISRVIEKYYVLTLMKVFLGINKIGLFFERIFT